MEIRAALRSRVEHKWRIRLRSFSTSPLNEAIAEALARYLRLSSRNNLFNLLNFPGGNLVLGRNGGVRAQA